MILVTGATGFVGSHLILHLAETEPKIRAMYRNETKIEQTKKLFFANQKQHLFDKIEWILADINNVPSLNMAFENIDFVFHCAGLISFDPDYEIQLRKVNIEGTANVVNFCLHKKIKKLIHVSSISAIGKMKESAKIIDETGEWNPEKQHSDYAISKYGAEMEVWRGQQEGLKVVIVNPGVIFGSWLANSEDKNGSMAIFHFIKKGLPFYTNGSTGFVSVKDVAKIMIALLQTNTVNERYILVSENLEFKDVFCQIADRLQLNRPSIRMSKSLTKKIFFIYSLCNKIFFQKQIFSKMLLQSVFEKNKYNSDKIIKTLKFKFESINFCINEIELF